MDHAFTKLPDNYKMKIEFGNGFQVTLIDDIGGEHVAMYRGCDPQPEELIVMQVDHAIQLDSAAKGITNAVSEEIQ